ncbi:MAG: deoxyribodipyrimidine photo-lyase [Saprospiraceae bacterium]
MTKISIFWFRRDLRLTDNVGLHQALQAGYPVLPIFIFDDQILSELPKDDARLSFIHQELAKIDEELKAKGSGVLGIKGTPKEVWKKLMENYEIAEVHLNRDYEPYARTRDEEIKVLVEAAGITFHTHKDQVVFEAHEVLKADGLPYTVYTPYKNKWLAAFEPSMIAALSPKVQDNYLPGDFAFPSLTEMGFEQSKITVQPYDLSQLDDYETHRNFPAADGTSYLSPHLRFGTVSTRQIMAKLKESQAVFLSELIWREFFMQILFHFPKVVDRNFRAKYDGIAWRNNKAEFELWCQGQTGYPMVDAGMRQLNATGYMHNRVRMVVASFLCKHLLIDWKWGEAYFAEKLLDFELSSNNGNWQWAAGTGCDAAPYFRIFNPESQLKKFDKELKYIKKWVPEFGSFDYVRPMVEHKAARQRALDTYKAGIALA